MVKHLQGCPKCRKLYDEVAIERLWNYGPEHVFKVPLTLKYKDCLSTLTIEDYIEGRLTEEEEQKVEDHLEKCEYCSSRIAAYGWVLGEERKYKEAVGK